MKISNVPIFSSHGLTLLVSPLPVINSKDEKVNYCYEVYCPETDSCEYVSVKDMIEIPKEILEETAMKFKEIINENS